jgi:hypothetical protein
MSLPQLIGISGVARSGKDTLAMCIKNVLAEQASNLSIEIRSLAKPLKDDIRDEIMEEFGIDVFHCTDEEKKLIRPRMVDYGKDKREASKGTYWTSLMDAEMVKLGAQGVDVIIVPDIRYCVFEEDEVFWVKKHGGLLIHVAKVLADGSILPPPNEDEAENDPKLKALADITIEWPEADFEACMQVVRELEV